MGLLGQDDRHRDAIQRHGEARQRHADHARDPAKRRGTSRGDYPEGSWQDEFDLYVVKRGDTLYGIAWQAYGDGKSWPRIQQANPVALANPEVVHPGLVIRIPKDSGKPLA